MSILNRKVVEYSVDRNGCWVCTSHSRNTSGYPTIKREGMTWTMNRYVLQEKLGRVLQENCYALHTCGNRGCINPDHIYEGTSLENRKDALNDGTARVFPSGAENPRSAVTDQVIEDVSKHPELSQRALAKVLGISQSLVWSIRKGITWKQLNLEEKIL